MDDSSPETGTKVSRQGHDQGRILIMQSSDGVPAVSAGSTPRVGQRLDGRTELDVDMESTAVHRHGEGRLGRRLCDLVSVLLGLLFLATGLFLLYGTLHYMGSGGRHINSAIGCALGVVALLFLGICLVLPTKLYVDRRLRIAGQLAASMTSAVMIASVVLPLVAMVSLWISNPSGGSAAGDVGGMLMAIITVIGLAAFLVFLPCTLILARKAKPRLAHLASGTIVVGMVGGLLGYLCH